MRKIEFIAPVEAMRGNMSGKQNLLYPSHNNSAWEAPSDQRSYARNYQPRYIGTKRSIDGSKFFAVKSRSAVKMTPTMRLNQALLGASKSCADAAMRHVTFRTAMVRWAAEYSRTGISLQQPEFLPSDFGNRGSIEGPIQKYLMRCFRQMLELHMKVFTFQDQSSNYTFKNPFEPSGLTGVDLNIGQSVIMKFWSTLNPNAIEFYVYSQKAISNDGWLWDNLIHSNVNFLGFAAKTIGQNQYATLNGLFVLDSDNDYQDITSFEPGVPGTHYTLTETPPES